MQKVHDRLSLLGDLPKVGQHRLQRLFAPTYPSDRFDAPVDDRQDGFDIEQAAQKRVRSADTTVFLEVVEGADGKTNHRLLADTPELTQDSVRFGVLVAHFGGPLDHHGDA